MEHLWIGIVALMTDPVAILLFFAALIGGLLFAALPGINMVTLKYKAPKVGLEFPSVRDFWRMRICIIRSWILGFCAGVLPGIGATLAAFLSYNEAKRWSKHPERFGKGELEGVVASETANNAATGGLFRKANHLARGALIAAAKEKSMTVSAEHVRLASTEVF